MTSLATVTHAAASVAVTFNSGFYTTIVTVIPVLLLAFAIQSPNAWQQMLQYAIRLTAVSRQVRPQIFSSLIPTSLLPAATILSWFMVGVAFLIVVAGLWGEVLAINALYNRSASPSSNSIVLASAVALTVAVVVVPISQGVSAHLFVRIEPAGPNTTVVETDKKPPCPWGCRIREKIRRRGAAS
jgi:hypothetical protein